LQMRRTFALFAILLLCSTASFKPTSGLNRRALLFGAASIPTSASAATFENPWGSDRTGLKNKALEKLRVALQDEADAVQYGGNEGLAPGGAPPATGVALIPILQMRQTLKTLSPSLETFDSGAWSDIRRQVSSGTFRTVEFKRVFNAFSDNIYYTSETAEANAYLLGGATPSTTQTTQYLQRNEALRQIGELRDEIDYQIGLPSQQRETDVAQEAMAAAIKAFDDYLKLAPPDQLKTARLAVPER